MRQAGLLTPRRSEHWWKVYEALSKIANKSPDIIYTVDPAYNDYGLRQIVIMEVTVSYDVHQALGYKRLKGYTQIMNYIGHVVGQE